MSGRGPRGIRGLIGVALLVPLLAGCELLFPGFAPPVPPVPGDEGFPNASPLTTFVTGTASVVVDNGAEIQLKQLHGDAELYPFVGANLTWEGPDGWYLRLLNAGAGSQAEFGPSYLTLERVREGEHWTTADPTRCVVDFDTNDKTGIKGTATCKGLQWHDQLAGYGFGGTDDETLIPDEPKFDATITFEASPEGPSS
jgi:hypothetical protein